MESLIPDLTLLDPEVIEKVRQEINQGKQVDLQPTIIPIKRPPSPSSEADEQQQDPELINLVRIMRKEQIEWMRKRYTERQTFLQQCNQVLKEASDERFNTLKEEAIDRMKEFDLKVLDDCMKLAERQTRRLRAAGLMLLNEPPLSTVDFAHNRTILNRFLINHA